MKARVERDRHFSCTPDLCVAPIQKRMTVGQQAGACIPRRSWYLRTKNSAGRRVSISFKTESEAREAARKMEAAAVLGVAYTPRAVAGPVVPTFSSVATEAFALYEGTRTRRASTLAGHRGFLKWHLMPYFGSKPITSVTALEIQRFIVHTRTKLSDSSIRTSIPTLQVVLDHAVRLGLLLNNPIRHSERLWEPAQAEPVDPFTASELRSILKAAREIDLQFAALIQVMAQGGLRPGEALAIRRKDVLAGAILHVQGSMGRLGRGPTKNPYSVRKVSVLHPVTEDRPVWHPKDAGEATRRVLDGLALVTALAPDTESRLWPINAVRLNRLWHRVLKAAGVRYRKPHALRHSFASIILSRDARALLYMVKAGGWKDANTLLKVYATWLPESDFTNMLVNRPVTPRPAEAVESTR